MEFNSGFKGLIISRCRDSRTSSVYELRNNRSHLYRSDYTNISLLSNPESIPAFPCISGIRILVLGSTPSTQNLTTLSILKYFTPKGQTINVINLLKPTGHVMHHQQFNIQQLYALPTQYLCVLYLSENKQRLVPLTA